MSSRFRALPASDLARSIEALLLPRLTEALGSRAPGHCMSVPDLGPELMVALAKGLRRQVPAANVHVLTGDATTPDGDLHITSTKLIELRNPRPDGSLRPPLCVFLPANLRMSAEDSFGSATFEESSVGDAYQMLRQQLLKRIPTTLQGYVRDALQLLREQRWRWADAVAQVRYLLCTDLNGNDGEAFGGALYELGLGPGFQAVRRPDRSLRSVTQESRVRPAVDERRLVRARPRAGSRPCQQGVAAAIASISGMPASRILLRGPALSSSTARIGICRSTSGSLLPRSHPTRSRLYESRPIFPSLPTVCPRTTGSWISSDSRC